MARSRPSRKSYSFTSRASQVLRAINIFYCSRTFLLPIHQRTHAIQLTQHLSTISIIFSRLPLLPVVPNNVTRHQPDSVKPTTSTFTPISPPTATFFDSLDLPALTPQDSPRSSQPSSSSLGIQAHIPLYRRIQHLLQLWGSHRPLDASKRSQTCFLSLIQKHNTFYFTASFTTTVIPPILILLLPMSFCNGLPRIRRSLAHANA